MRVTDPERPARRSGQTVGWVFLALVGLTSIAAERPASADAAKFTAALTPDAHRLHIDVHGVPPPAPVFFSAAADQTVRLTATEITSEIRLTLRVMQGRPEILTLRLIGEGDVTDVSGKELRDWAVRIVGERRFLDLRTTQSSGLGTSRSTSEQTPAQHEFVVRTRHQAPAIPGNVTVLTVAAGEAVGFAAKVTLSPEPSVGVRVVSVTGAVPAEETMQFFSAGEARIEVRLTHRGAAAADAELVDAQLVGRVNEGGDSVDFRLRGQLRAQKAGARVRVLAGRAALSEISRGEFWRVELSESQGSWAYDLVAEREGLWLVDLRFVAAVREEGDWRALEFAMPAGAVVPVQLEGLSAGVSFKTDVPVVPVATPRGWQGFLPADGRGSLAWRRARESAEAALAFTSTEQTEVRVGAGLLRQTAQLSFRILQGKLGGLRCRIEGQGEILGVEGSNVVGWKVLPGEAARILEVRFNHPMEAEGSLTVQSQAQLGSWPARVEPMRITPEGGVRHSGFVRLANSGAVRIEVSEIAGMMQLAPAQFPGGAAEKEARQIFVYRFPSATYAYRVLATQIMPEVGVSLIATYELTDTARVINAALELDVREAPLRDWTLRIPEDYTMASLTGADVVDHVAESVAANGTRALRVLFGREIAGRQLLHMRVEKNQPAGAGEWALPALQFPGAKTVRGHLGAVSTAGYRLVPTRVERLVEVPLSFFPKQTPGLQQSWRVREPGWTAEVRVEALGQSVQADVFHLYSLKQGVVASSVLLNYFVVGAPATEWRIAVPAGVGNMDVIGQNVRRDWRREGDNVIVTLHQPVLGAATLLVTFERPMSTRGGVIAPGEVRPLGVQSERGFIQVVSPLQVKHEVRRAEGALLKLEATELPAEFRLLTSAPSLAVNHYTARPFAFELGIEWYAAGETVDQVVDFARLASQVSRDGQVVTEAKYFVKTRGRKALRLVLPEGAKLWEARVDNEVVHARTDGDHTVIPLPARANPNDPVVVVLRVGQTARGATAVKVLAPRAATAPTVINEWVLHSDTGRLLVPRDGNAELVNFPLTETGFEWVSQRGGLGSLITLSLIGLGALLLRAGGGVWRLPAGLFAFSLATAAALWMTTVALNARRVNIPELSYAATIVPAGETVSLHVANLPEWRAMIVWWGIAAAVAGLAALVFAGRAKRTAEPSGIEGYTVRPGRLVLPVAGVILLVTGLLAQRGGAVLFFAAISAAVFARMLVPGVILWRRERRERLDEPGASAAGAVTVLMLGLLVLGFGASDALAAAAKPGSAGGPRAFEALAGRNSNATASSAPLSEQPAQALTQTWSIRGDRLFAELELSVRGKPGESFLLLRPPAVLTDFKGDGLRVSKVERDGDTAYYAIPEREGVLSARARFEMPLPDRTKPIALPTGPAAAQRIAIELDQPGWEFASPMAVAVVPRTDLGEQRSGATLVLLPHAAPVIQLRPRQRDVGAEQTQFFAESATVFVPGPGVVNGFTRMSIRPVQGRVSAVEIQVPAGFTVGDVSRGPVGAWRFDPKTQRLQVALEPEQTNAFRFEVETQLGAGELPFALALEPLRVRDAAGDIGMLALAFGGDAQPEAVRVMDLSPVNVQDFDASLLPRAREGHPAATVQNAWRFGAAAGRVELKVAPVAPEVRVTIRQVLTLDDDRMVMAVDLRVAITRVGLFKLSFPLPEGLELEALTGAALNHWTEAPEVHSTGSGQAPSTGSGQGAQRVVTLYLNGRTMGEHAFNLSLVGPAPRTQDGWPFPRFLIREATRQTADALVVPGKGIRLRATERERVTQLDPRTVGGQQPGTLAFRLLQEDWVLRLGLEALEAWVTVHALQEVTLREGQTLTRIAARYRIENAPVKFVRFRLPDLDEASAATVRATGSAVADTVRVADAPDTWEVRFQRGVAGDADVQIEYQSAATRARAEQSIMPPEYIGVRQTVQFVAVRSGGRLELEASALPRGWTRVDWGAVPPTLAQRGDRTVPTYCFRVAEPEAALIVRMRRHEVADALKLRVTQGELLTLCSPEGAFLTAVELKLEVIEKSTLRVRLPVGAQLFNTFVNGESVAVVREGDAWLFHVVPNAAGARGAAVRLVYAATAREGRAVNLLGPSLSVPLENVTWRVVIPPGYELGDYSGGLRLREERAGELFGIDQYVSLVSSKRTAETREAMSILQQANTWMAKGEQEKAAEALSRVAGQANLDAASNEDARVQLRNLKTQQAVLSLNTRRQRLYFDNRGDTAQNAQLEQAANLNPFMQGKLNYDPRHADQLLLGNTAEENSALRGIASRIVDQQLAAEPAPGAIDVTLPQRGRVMTFTRTVQVDGSAPLELKLDLDKVMRTNVPLIAILLLGIAVMVGVELGRRPNGHTG